MIGHYEVLEPLGQGGMGDVYLARDVRLGRRVALKFLLHVNSKLSARFFVEARATAQLAHENIVSLYDIAEHHSLPYMVLEYVPGKTLSTWLHERQAAETSEPVPPQQAAQIMLPVVRALQCAHEAGIVHRDLKPANIMLTKSGSVKVLDFGVAKLLGDAARPAIASDSTAESQESKSEKTSDPQETPNLTESGALVGTRAYMAPEQWWDESVDGRTDIWAVGIILYQMVTGVHPSIPMSTESFIRAAECEDPMPSVFELVPSIGELGTVIDRCLRKNKDARWGSASELCDALERITLQSPEPRIAPKESAISDKNNSTAAETSTTVPGNAPVSRSARPPRWHWLLLLAPVAAVVIAVGIISAQRSARDSLVNASPNPSSVGSSANRSGSACATNAECIAKIDGKPAYCRKDTGACVSLETEVCRVLAEPADIANDAMVWIGAMYPYGVNGQIYGKQAVRAIELARKDFQELGGIPTLSSGGKPRPVGIVLCDDSRDPQLGAHHLVDRVNVPAILGFARSKEVMDLATELLLPKGVFALASNTASTLVEIPHAPGEPRLVLRVTTSADMVNRPKASFVEEMIEPLLKKKRILRKDQGMRIALIRSNNVSGISHADKLLSLLHWNGKNAHENVDLIRQFVVPDQLERKNSSEVLHPIADNIGAFAPHLVIEAGVDDEPIMMIERRWPATNGFRPLYLIDGAIADPVIHRFFAASDDIARRLFSVQVVVSPAYHKFVMHHNEVFTEEIIDVSSSTSAPYDAFYALIYTIVALGDAPITGKALAQAIWRIVPPGEPIDVGPAGIYKAIKILREGKNIDLGGAQTSLDFDPETGDPTVEFTVDCMDTKKQTLMNSGLVFDAKTKKFAGTWKCP
jgi:serine/threonine protein kinase